MAAMDTQGWLLDAFPDEAGLASQLGVDLTLEEESQTFSLLLDDVDWHLWQAGETLTCHLPKGQGSTEARCLLLGPTPGLPVSQTRLPGPPVFWWDLPAGSLQQALRKRLGLHALRVVLQVAVHRRILACRDDEGKILLRLELVQQSLQEAVSPVPQGPDRLLLRCRPLRGYEAVARQLLGRLQPWLGEAESIEDEASQWLAWANLNPAAELLPQPVPLQPDRATGPAILQLALLYWQQAGRYEPGILADVDTECLHQYRVNLRRIRSLFSLMKKALPDELASSLRRQLADLARPTGLLRDLDVLLLQEADYLAWLPATYHEGLRGLLRRVEQQRRKAQQQLQAHLTSETHARQCQALQQALQTPLQPEADSWGARPLCQAARERILRCHRRVRRLGRAITPQTPDEEVHALRIECKKLRYLLDFFASLFPAQALKPQLRALKQLQTILGDFNDYGVQQVFLAGLIEADTPVAQQAAVHGLVALLHRRQRAAAEQVMQALAAYAQQPLNLKEA